MKDGRERDIALQEAHTAASSDSYFGARRAFDTDASRTLFEAGHKRGFEDGLKAARAQMTKKSGCVVCGYAREFDGRCPNCGCKV